MPNGTPIVFVVDDDVSVRESLSLLIESAGWQPETFASGPEFLARSRVLEPSCLVLDLVLPNVNGCDLQKMVADRTDMPVIFISGHVDVPIAVHAMKAGALDFFTKPLVSDVLLGTIRNALTRSRAALWDAEHMRAFRARYASLSHREREVMALVVAGRLNKQVGGELGISEVTVKAHRSQVMRKMKATSLPDLVFIAVRLRQGERTVSIGNGRIDTIAQWSGSRDFDKLYPRDAAALTANPFAGFPYEKSQPPLRHGEQGPPVRRLETTDSVRG